MSRAVLLGVCAAVSACASASLEDVAIDARTTDGRVIDATGDIDAPIDASATPITLTQTTSSAIGPESSLACGNVDGTTAENSWYRVFKLADAGITGGLRVNSVTFGVQEALGMPSVEVRIGTYSGSITPPPAQLDITLISPLISATAMVPNTLSSAAMTFTVPITANVPALSQMIVEVYAPNFNGLSKYLYLGGNGSGEARPAYLRAPACNTPQPRTAASLGFPTSHLVINVSGTH